MEECYLEEGDTINPDDSRHGCLGLSLYMGDVMIFKVVIMLNDVDFTSLLDFPWEIDIPEDERRNVNDAMLCELWYNDGEVFK